MPIHSWSVTQARVLQELGSGSAATASDLVDAEPAARPPRRR